MQIGADEFLTKPISPERLVTAIIPPSTLDDATQQPDMPSQSHVNGRAAQHRAFAHAAPKYVLGLCVGRPRPFQVGERYLQPSDRRTSSEDHLEYAQTAFAHDGLNRPV